MESEKVQIVQKNNIDPGVNEHLGELKKVFDKQESDKKELTNKEILENVTSMMKLKKQTSIKKLKITNINEYRKKFMNEYLQLHLNYPTIYNMVLESDDFELNRLKEMLEMRQRVQDSKITNFDASVQISQKYTNEFIKKPLNID